MRGFWLLVHVLGFTLWLGGGIATMVAGVTAKRLGTTERLSAYRLIGVIQRVLVGPGAIAVVLSGIVLGQPYMRSGAMPGWVSLMMIAGILGALGVVAISVPTAAKLARLESQGVQLAQALVRRPQRGRFLERTAVSWRRHGALVHSERRVALARTLVGAGHQVQPAYRAVILVVPYPVSLDAILDAPLRERDRGLS